MSLRLMIVDDSRMSRLILQGLILQAHPQWTIVHASSGEEALQLVRENPVDLVSMDFNMAGMNGLEAALALREILPAVPIAILTANVQTAVQFRDLPAAELEAYLHIEQPYDCAGSAKSE
eukprot:gene31799-54165_t